MTGRVMLTFPNGVLVELWEGARSEEVSVIAYLNNKELDLFWEWEDTIGGLATEQLPEFLQRARDY